MAKALITDLYEIAMSYVYFRENKEKEEACFDVFFRKIPDEGGYVISAGLESIIEYVKNFSFEKDDIDFLRESGNYSEDFIAYLSTLKFTGDIYAVKEGTVIFPYEPVITIKAPIIEAQLLETYLLMLFNHQSLIATKANRIVRAAQGRPITEFGARRAHGESAAVLGARAAYIGGCVGTSVVEDEKRFGVKSFGTMAHSYVQSFPNEYEAFKAFALAYPNNSSFLIDTYNCLKSGLPNAMRVFKEILEPMGIKKGSVRIDSGDLSYLSNEVRKVLDMNNLGYVKIMLTNSLDEGSISEMIANGANVDLFGVGERLITSSTSPVLDGVYKMCARIKNGKVEPLMKISESAEKTTNPGIKKVYRIYDKKTGNAEADLIVLSDETIDNSSTLTIFDPVFTYKQKTYSSYYLRELLEPIFIKGKLVYESPSAKEIRDYAMNEINTLWPEVKRFRFPHNYYVDLSDKLYALKQEMIKKELHGGI
ncbi:MAG: nicotinate phosphoribosyltransferase [Bacillales bacterium]|nr:nicotinate phosphoribosyltransferase [Bacillales bacterium]